MRELLAAAQAERKAKLDAGRIDTVFKVCDRVLLRTKELLDAAESGKLRPRLDGPFTVTGCPSLNAYTLALPRKMRCHPTVNVDGLEPLFLRAGTTPAPGPVSDAVQEGEHQVMPVGARHDALPGTLAGSHVCLRRVVAGGGAGALPCTRWRSTTPRPRATTPPAGSGPTPRLLQPQPRPRCRHSWRPPGRDSRPRPRS